jgi:hypothetical protein
MKYLILPVLCVLFIPVQAQVFLQLERAGTLKTIRYTEGDMLTFRLKNDDKGWYDRTIVSIDAAKNRIIFPDVIIHTDSIDAIRLEKKAVVAQILGTALQVGGINLILFTGYDAIFRDRDLDWTSMASGGLNIAVGTLLKKVFRHAVFRISSRKRVRLIDLRFSDPMEKP